jgi:uncharacterized membrane protein (TIGR02234 family)
VTGRPSTSPTGRRSFGPVVLLGLGAGTLAAVAGTRSWVDWDAEVVSAAAPAVGYSISGDVGEVPLAAALAFVVLACWGVLLVTRGPVRRGVALLASLASLGLLATTAFGWSSAADPLRRAFDDYDVTGHDLSRSWWYWVAVVGAVVSVVAAALAVRLVPQWPEMGRRYDAPGAAAVAQPDAAAEEQSNLELWRALDEGHDPTAGPTP